MAVRRLIRFPVLALLGVLFVLILPVGLAAADDPSTAQITSDLADDGVATYHSDADESKLRAQVERAADAGYTLQVVVIGTSTTQTADAIARAVRGTGSTTVLVLTPDSVAVASGEISQDKSDELFSATDRDGADVAVVTSFVDQLTKKAFPWIWTVVAAVVAALLLVLGARVIERTRERRRRISALSIEQGRLKTKLSGWSDDIVDLDSAVTLRDDPAIRQRYAEATAEYSDLGTALESPITDRAEADRLTGRVDALLKEIGELKQETDVSVSSAGTESSAAPASSDAADH